MAELEFRDPPVPSSQVRPLTRDDLLRNADRNELIAKLVEHPDQWAIVSRHLSQSAAHKTAGLLRRRNVSGYQFAARTEPDGTAIIYARYRAGPS